MTMDDSTITRLAAHLEECELTARDTLKITDEFPDMSWEDAYAIQDAICRRKVQRGARVVGFKAGLTSQAKMKQMNIETPIFGFLVDGFAVPDGGTIDTRTLIHPKVEPEIAFVMKSPLAGPGCHIGQVLAATDFIVAAIEVIDSRYRDFKFDLPSVIADNTSAARFVTGGRPRKVAEVDLCTLGVVLEKNGIPVAFGAGAAVLNHPAAAVAMLANELGKKGREIPAGALILSGGITEAVAVETGSFVTLRMQDMGSIGLRFS